MCSVWRSLIMLREAEGEKAGAVRTPPPPYTFSGPATHSESTVKNASEVSRPVADPWVTGAGTRIVPLGRGPRLGQLRNMAVAHNGGTIYVTKETVFPVSISFCSHTFDQHGTIVAWLVPLLSRRVRRDSWQNPRRTIVGELTSAKRRNVLLIVFLWLICLNICLKVDKLCCSNWKLHK